MYRDLTEREAIKDHIKKWCSENNVELSDVFRKSKRPQWVQIRWAVWKELHKAGFSFAGIGRVFDTDHSTISYGIKANDKSI